MKTYGYCDLHPECRLWESGSLIANNSLDGTGSANPLLSWMCSRKDCLRVWSRELGYFTQKLGESIDYAGTGPRCPSDNSFMVVGDSTTIRRYLCPVSECAEVGPAVDTSGEDCGPLKQHVPHEGKEERELRIFKQFARAADLAIENARNCAPHPVSHPRDQPPYPDITFTLAGEEKYVELAEITDETLAKRRASLLKGNTEEGFTYSQGVPLLKTICDKASKSYTTEGKGVDLLLYYDKQLPSVTGLTQFLHEHTVELGKLKKPIGPFSEVLIFDTWNNAVLWKTTS